LELKEELKEAKKKLALEKRKEKEMKTVFVAFKATSKNSKK
jgi:hypothetical protein